MNFIEIATNFTILIPLYVAINQFIKAVFPNINSRIYPVINLVLGFTAFPLITADLYTKILSCIILGLTAGGLYDLGKKTILNK